MPPGDAARLGDDAAPAGDNPVPSGDAAALGGKAPARDNPAAEVSALQRRAAIAMAGFAGDEQTVRAGLQDEEPSVRTGALQALVRLGAATAADTARAIADPAAGVRRAACELAPRLPGADYAALLVDADPSVVEAAAFATGEVADRSAVPALARIAAEHEDPLCRESAVAALGAIGDEGGRASVLGALDDVPAIRRRAVVALAAFEGEEVEAALRERLHDRDWQVRQAAEDVLGEH